MKEEIQKILEMRETGIISLEQATELIAALSDDKSQHGNNSGPVEPRQQKRSDFAGDLGNSIRTIVNDALGLAAEATQDAIGQAAAVTQEAIRGANIGDNSSTLSSVTAATGTNFRFVDNSFNVSKASKLHFEESQFVDNSVNASSISDVSLLRSQMRDVGLHGSSVNKLQLEDSSLRDISVNGSKFGGLVMADGSDLKTLSFTEQSSRTSTSRIQRCWIAKFGALALQRSTY
jgi:hypothetical protein